MLEYWLHAGRHIRGAGAAEIVLTADVEKRIFVSAVTCPAKMELCGAPS